MSDLNTVCLYGRLTKDADKKQTTNGKTFIQFCIATNRERKNANGTWESIGNFFPVRIFGKWGESLWPYLKKGQAITLQGHLLQFSWQKDNMFFSRIDIVPEQIRLVGNNPAKPNNALNTKEPVSQLQENSQQNSQQEFSDITNTDFTQNDSDFIEENNMDLF